MLIFIDPCIEKISYIDGGHLNQSVILEDSTCGDGMQVCNKNVVFQERHVKPLPRSNMNLFCESIVEFHSSSRSCRNWWSVKDHAWYKTNFNQISTD